jgi:hypothetical protein
VQRCRDAEVQSGKQTSRDREGADKMFLRKGNICLLTCAARFLSRECEQVPYLWGISSSTGFTCGAASLARGKKCTQGRASPFWWGLYVLQLRCKKYKPLSKREREVTWFPHTPTGDPH